MMHKVDRLSSFQDSPYSKEEERQMSIDCMKEILDVTNPVLKKHFGDKVLTGSMINLILLPCYLSTVKKHFAELPKKERDPIYAAICVHAIRILQNSFTNMTTEEKQNDNTQTRKL